MRARLERARFPDGVTPPTLSSKSRSPMNTLVRGISCARSPLRTALVAGAVLAGVAAATSDSVGTARRAPPAPEALRAATFVQEGLGPPRKSALQRIEPPEVPRSASVPSSKTDPDAPRAAAGSSVGDVDGPVALSLAKSWNGASWDLALSWSGQIGAATVVTSPHPSFESSVTTLAKELALATLTVAERPSRMLECFDVTDSTTVSRAVQGLGYDPDPPPLTPSASLVPDGTLAADDIWWGDTVRISSGYLDPIPAANSMGMQSRLVRAHAVSGVSGAFASAADFDIPEDARSHWMAPAANGLPPRGAQFLSLYPRGSTFGPFTQLRAISWAPQTGHAWIADDTAVEALDIFRMDPQMEFGFLDLNRPYLSRVTNTGKILYVEGNLSVAKVWQVDVVTGTRTEYANTTDATFTRAIRPVGIAVRPDETACYIADASPGDGAGRIVKIPQNNSSPIKDDYGAWPYWSFADPAGTEVGLDGTVYVGASNQWIGQIPDATHTWWFADTTSAVRSLLVDRDVSSSSSTRIWWSPFAGWAHAYNRSPLASAGGQPRYVGATLVHEGDNRINMAPQWNYLPLETYVVWPARVILNRSGQPFDYLWAYQTDDRLAKLVIRGWDGIPIHLRLIDPPDLSPYAPDGGFPPRGGRSAIPPYEANDNRIWADPAYADFGLTVSPDGTLDPGEPWPVLELDVVPGEDNLAVVYVKLPAQRAGDNWQVQVYRTNLYGSVLNDKVAGFSQVITGWKRVHLERERMFVRGGLLARNASPGDTRIFVAKYPEGDGTYARADDLVVGDSVAIFDTTRPFRGPAHDVACVKAIQPGAAWDMEVVLGRTDSCATSYALKYDYGTSVDPTTHAWTFADGTRSGGVGVVDGCSVAPNLVNVLASCFWTVDVGAAEGAYRDAYVNVHAPGLAGGEMPYLPEIYFEHAENEDVSLLSKRWFENFFPKEDRPLENQPHNYFHAIGAGRAGGWDGYAHSGYDWLYVFVSWIESYGYLPEPTKQYIRETVVHELAHLFDVNPDTCSWHDGRMAWCSGELACLGVECFMNDASPGTRAVHEFCRQDLWDGVAAAGSTSCPDGSTQTWEAGDGAVRTEEDPK